MTRRRVGWAAGLVGAAGILTLVWRILGPDTDADSALLVVEGVVEVRTPDGDVEKVSDRRRVDFDAEVVVRSGSATLEIADGTFGLRAGIDHRSATHVVVGEVPELMAGDLLVETPKSAEVESAGERLRVDRGSAQLALHAGLDVKVYSGRVELGGSRDSRVDALRSVSIGENGSSFSEPSPLAYVGQDPWDRRFLGAAIAFGDELERKTVGLVDNLPASTIVDASFLKRTLPALADQRDFGSELVGSDKRPSELLVGASISSLGRRGDFVDRWKAVFAFREAGAHWGLVALDQGVSEMPGLEVMDVAIKQEELAFSEPSRPVPEQTGGPPATVSPPVTSAPSTGTPSPTLPAAPPPAPQTRPSPPTTRPSGPLAPVLDPVLDPVGELVDELLGDVVGGLLGK